MHLRDLRWETRIFGTAGVRVWGREVKEREGDGELGTGVPEEAMGGRALGWSLPSASMGIPKHSFSRQGLASAVQVPMPGTERALGPQSVLMPFLGRLCTRRVVGAGGHGRMESTAQSGRVELRHQLTGEQPRS